MSGGAPELEIRATPSGGCLLRVAARPGASRSAIQGIHGGALKVAVAAPPEKGKANKELIRFLAKALGLRRDEVALHSGETSRDKVIAVARPAEALRTGLASLMAEEAA